jgi:predicted nuclease of restriction endonuclease-like (RecB) superfamily
MIEQQIQNILSQPPFHRLLHAWQIGECLNEAGLMDDFSELRQIARFISEHSEWNCKTHNLREICRVHAAFPHGVDTRLTWSHYVLLARLPKRAQRQFYEQQAAQAGWTTLQLKRQMQSFYFRRSQQQQIKQHYDFSFLTDLAPHYSERALEDALWQQLPDFLLELGHGFSLVARQQLLRTYSGKNLYIDWVFYHFQERRFVLIDLKVQPLQHHHIGQLDTYVRLFDTHWRDEIDAPTVGVLLCPSWDHILWHHSALAKDEQLYVAEYRVGGTV